MTQELNKVATPPVAGGQAGARQQNPASYTTLKVKRAVFEELLVAKEKGVYGTWTAFFTHALVRCPLCGGIVVVKHNKLKCTSCGSEYRLCQH